MKKPIQLQFRFPDTAATMMGEIIVDSFAGGGGASLGIELALGRSPEVAINHDAAAIAMHEMNHPSTRHYREDIWALKPLQVTEGQPVGLLWASPDCRHFSRAKGGKPVSPRVRGLAWVVVRWAREVRPRVICLENVPEFLTWGPLLGDQPDPARAGLTFQRWAGQLRSLGYEVEHRILNAADYGAPTSRRRLFLVARRDGLPIRWPEPTHGPGRPLPWRTAAECIDWSLPCPSIFGRARPLAEATLRRIARGLVRYVLQDKNPFIIRTDMHKSNAGCAYPLAEPLRTITTGGGHAVVSPTLVQTGYGERKGQAPRAMDVKAPLGTVVAGGQKHALVSAFLAKHYGGVVGQSVQAPLGTVTAVDHHSLVAAHLTKLYGTATGADPRKPMPTATSGGQHIGVVAAFLAKYYGTAVGQSVGAPLDTITGHDRFGLVTVTLDGEEYALVDIGMRMLQPHELAAAQGFPPEYILTGTKSQQVARIGNSVCPPVAAALVAANLVENQIQMEATA